MAVITALQSCTIAGTIDFYNNTDRAIVLHARDSKVEIPSRSHARANVGLGIKVTVDSPQGSAIYDLEDLHPSLYKSKGWGPFSKRVLKAQLEASGEIWFVPEEVKFPAKIRPEQPYGFPLFPVNGPNHSLQADVPDGPPPELKR